MTYALVTHSTDRKVYYVKIVYSDNIRILLNLFIVFKQFCFDKEICYMDRAYNCDNIHALVKLLVTFKHSYAHNNSSICFIFFFVTK